MKTLPLMLLISYATAYAQEAPAPAPAPGASQEAPAESEKVLVVSVELNQNSAPGTLAPVSKPLNDLIKQGWRVSQCTTLTSDKTTAQVLVVLDQGVDKPQDPATAEPTAGEGAAPGPAGAPSPATVPPGVYHLTWWDGSKTTVTVGGVVGGRTLASVFTNPRNGAGAVSYPAIASKTEEGVISIDARGAPVSGPGAQGFSPDSIVIQKDGSAQSRDDLDNTGTGQLAPAATPAPAAPQDANPPSAPQAPHPLHPTL